MTVARRCCLVVCALCKRQDPQAQQPDYPEHARLERLRERPAEIRNRKDGSWKRVSQRDESGILHEVVIALGDRSGTLTVMS